MNIHTTLARIPVSLVLVAALAAALWPGESEARTNPQYCTKIFRIVPADGGKPRPLEVKKAGVEFPADEKKIQEDDDDRRYNGWNYTRIGRASQFVDCAGNVLRHLWGPGPYVVGAGTFYDNIVLPFGKQINRISAQEGDIVVFQALDTEGKVRANHIAHIVSVPLLTTTIETKDGKESTYRTALPISGNAVRASRTQAQI